MWFSVIVRLPYLFVKRRINVVQTNTNIVCVLCIIFSKSTLAIHQHCGLLLRKIYRNCFFQFLDNSWNKINLFTTRLFNNKDDTITKLSSKTNIKYTYFNLLKPIAYKIYRLLLHSLTSQCFCTMHSYVLYVSQNKRWLWPRKLHGTDDPCLGGEVGWSWGTTCPF